MNDNRQTFTITVRATGPGPETIIRLRRGLKMLLRSCGLRAVDVREVKATNEKTPPVLSRQG